MTEPFPSGAGHARLRSLPPVGQASCLSPSRTPVGTKLSPLLTDNRPPDLRLRTVDQVVVSTNAMKSRSLVAQTAKSAVSPTAKSAFVPPPPQFNTYVNL
jgi:hypothetical protein